MYYFYADGQNCDYYGPVILCIPSFHVVVFTHAEAPARSRTCTHAAACNINARPCERNRRHFTQLQSTG